MSLFFLLLAKIMPLVALIGVGWVSGRVWNVDRKSIANLLVYIIIPIVLVGKISETPMPLDWMLVTPVFFVVGCILGLVSYGVARRIWTAPDDHVHNLAGFMGGCANTGFFGFPVVLALFDNRLFPLVVLADLGLGFYQVTLGYYLMSRSASDVESGLLRMVKFPPFWGVLAGIGMQVMGWQFPPDVMVYVNYFVGAVIVLGMMMIGLGLVGAFRGGAFHPRFIALMMSIKFILWPLVMWMLVVLDRNLLGVVGHQEHMILMILSVMPLAANSITYAVQLNLPPARAASTVLISSLLATLLVPLIYVLMSG